MRLRSADPSADPLIDPNYYATEADRVVIREGMRLAMRALETSEDQAIVDGEVVPGGFEALTSKSTDGDIDKRVKSSAATCFHGQIAESYPECQILTVSYPHARFIPLRGMIR